MLRRMPPTDDNFPASPSDRQRVAFLEAPVGIGQPVDAAPETAEASFVSLDRILGEARGTVEAESSFGASLPVSATRLRHMR